MHENNLAKNAFWLTFSYILCWSLNAVTMLLLPRLLGAHDFGEYCYVLWIMSWVGIFTQVGIPEAARKFVANLNAVGDQKSIAQLTIHMLKYQSALAITACVGVCCLIGCFVHNEHSVLLIRLAALYMVPSILASILANSLNGMDQIHVTSKVVAVCGAITCVASLAIILAGGGAAGLLAVTLVSNTIYLIVIGIIFVRALKARAKLATPPNLGDKPLRGLTAPSSRTVIAYCAGATAAAACTALALDKSEIYFLQLTAGLQAVAMYSVAFNLSQKLLLLPQAFAGILVPAFAHKTSHGDDNSSANELFCNSLKIYLLLIAPASVLLASQSNLIIRMLYGERFLPAESAFSVALLTVPAAAFTVPATSMIFGINGVTRRSLMYMLIPVAMDLGLSALLIPHFGVIGAACANLATQWTMAAVVSFYVATTHKFTLPHRYIAKMAAVCFTGGIVSFALSRVAPDHCHWLGFFPGALVCLLLIRELRVLSAQEIVLLRQTVGRRPAFVRAVCEPIVDLLSKPEKVIPATAESTFTPSEPAAKAKQHSEADLVAGGVESR